MSHASKFVRLPLILLIVQSASCGWKPNNPTKEAVCNTPACLTKGQEYKTNMDPRADPCQDFFTFTCGNWPKNHPGPKYTDEWTVVDVIKIEFLQLLRKNLESYIPQPDDSILFRNAKAVYETCVKIPEYPKKEANDIAREITKIGRVPKTSLWEIHSKYLRLTGESAFFRYRVMSSHASERLPVLIMLEPSSAYGIIDHGEIWKPQEQKAYLDFLFLIMKRLNRREPDAVIKVKIQKVFEFRQDFDRVIHQNLERKPETFNPFTGQAMNKWFTDIIRTKTRTQDISWPEVIDALLPHVPAETRQTRKIIAMRQKQFFLDMMALFKTVPEEVLANHIEINFVERHLQLTDDMYKLLEVTSIEPHDLFEYIEEIYYPRWYTCLKHHNMQKTLEKLLYRNWPKEDLQMVREINDKIKIAIQNQMGKCTWLDQPTREATTKKLKNLEEWFGFPPWINGETLPTVRVKTNILEPAAQLYIPSNLLYVQAPLLLPPLFSTKVPALYNYAGIGSTLGHELYHIIDDCGSFELEVGSSIWWPQETREKCLGNKLLFVEAYNAITDRDYKNRYNVELKSDTSNTVLENYPDVMGLKAAYNAYKELLSTDKSACKTLPHFEQYSCDQMFYITYGNGYCGYYTNKSARDKLKSSVHSIDSIRVNGAPAQMKSFATAFGCPVGTPMNPKEKPNLWK